MTTISDTDIEITYTFEDEKCEPIDTSVFSGIVAKVYQRGLVIAKFSLNSMLMLNLMAIKKTK